MNRNVRESAAAPAPGRRIWARGFTLIELLIVVTIMGLLTVAALPTILTSLDQREILDAAGMLQSALLVSRDNAMRTGNPSGVRLMLDPDASTNGALAANRLVPITQAPDYNNGQIRFNKLSYTTTYTHPVLGVQPLNFSVLVAYEYKFNSSGVLDANYSPTDWYWNIRQGEKMRINGTGRAYTIAGPMLSGGGANNMAASNPERFVNADVLSGNNRVVSLPTLSMNYPSTVVVPPYLYPLAPDNWPNPIVTPSTPATWNYNALSPALGNQFQIDTTDPSGPYHYIDILNTIKLSAAEYVVLFNGIDDDKDGYTDEGFDGIDNDGDGIIDPGFNGIDDNGDGIIDDPAEMLLRYDPYYPGSGEYEPESFDITNASAANSTTVTPYRYIINRRAIVPAGARETRLPANIVIDLTMLDRYSSTSEPLRPERSRLPLDPISQMVDILFGPNGQVIEDTAGISTLFNNRNLPFYHFWLATKSDVYGAPYINPSNHADLRLAPPILPARILPTNDPTGAFSATGAAPLKKERRLVTLFPKTGNTVVNSVEDFTTIDQPFLDAQFGTREP